MSDRTVVYRKAVVFAIAILSTNIGAFSGMSLGWNLYSVFQSDDANAVDPMRNELLARFGGGLVGVAVFVAIGMTLIARLNRRWARPPDQRQLAPRRRQ